MKSFDENLCVNFLVRFMVKSPTLVTKQVESSLFSCHFNYFICVRNNEYINNKSA